MKIKESLKEKLEIAGLVGILVAMAGGFFMEKAKWNDMKKGASEIISCSKRVIARKDYAIFRDSKGAIYRIDFYEHSFVSPRGGMPAYYAEYKKGSKYFEKVLDEVKKSQFECR